MDRTDNDGDWPTAKPEVGRAARRELDPSKLAYNDELKGLRCWLRDSVLAIWSAHRSGSF